MTLPYHHRLPLPAVLLTAWIALSAGFIMAAEPSAAEVVAVPADSPAVQRLAGFGLVPTAESIGGYLTSLQPSPEREAALLALIRQLGDDDFARREDASRQLSRQSAGANALLEKAVVGDDAEVRWRARRILDQTQSESKLLMGSVLTVIHERQIRGLCAPLLAAADFCSDEQLRSQHRKALVATAATADAPLLRLHLSSRDPACRLAAMTALAAVIGSDSDADALRLLSDSDESVLATAARALADHGRRESLPVLVRLLESSEPLVRLKAIQTLRQLTGQDFNFRGGYDTPERRELALSQWKAWLTNDAATAPLSFPLREITTDLGRILLCDHNRSLLIEFDTSGRQVWQKTVGAQPWACLGLPNGHRLVGSYGEKSVVEFDDKGDEVWRVEGLPGGPTSIQRLENGNTLVACTEGSQIVEIDPAKRTVWKAAIDGRPVDARRLDDGRTLVTLQHAQKVVELDAAGKPVWEISGLGMAFSAERLESGNTLVCALGHNKVREFDRAGKIVWEKGAFANPYCAQRIAGGNTLVVDNTGLTEIDPQGTVVSRIQMQNVSRAWRY